MIYANDKLTIKREKYEVIDNEAVKKIETIETDIPCHLSVNLNNTVYIQNAPYIVSDFTIFLNYTNKLNVKENDFLVVTSKNGQIYELIAGEIKIYNFSIQIKCRQKKIIEDKGE